LILPEELACVETNLKKHLEGHKYRAAIRKNQIVIHESQGSGYAEILSQLGWNASESPDHKFREHIAQYSPINYALYSE
jgi:hypothetical protein